LSALRASFRSPEGPLIMH